MKNITFLVSEEFHKSIKIKIATEGISLKDYIISLLEKDLKVKNNKG